MAASQSKEEYLRRYLSGENYEDKSRKRKKKVTAGKTKIPRSKIIDDDVDFKTLLPENLGNTLDEDIHVADDDPVIVGVIDDRPEEVIHMEQYRADERWRILGLDKVADKQSHVASGRHDSDSDQSPTRRIWHDSDSDQSPPRRIRHDSDSDQSPPRRKRFDSDQSPPRRKRHNSNSDQSPPRRKRHDSNSDQSPPRRKRHNSNSDQSPPRRKRFDSDQSPPRRKRLDSDQSPPRKKRDHSNSDQSPQRRKRLDSDSNQSPPRRQKSTSRSKESPPKRRRRRRWDSGDSPSRKTDRKSPPKTKGEDTDEIGRAKKTLSGATAGLSSARQMREEAKMMKQREDEMFNQLDDTVLGKNAKTVFRDRGKRKTSEERKQEEEDEEKKVKRDAKYKAWNKGLKQIELQQKNFEEAVHEMNKPMARYGDDTDLDKELKERDREGDPMLAYMMKKKKPKTGGQSKELPRYSGPQPPLNRFSLWPGYRWDGVDRSNGFEQKLFARKAEKKAIKDIAYKWSVEDM